MAPVLNWMPDTKLWIADTPRVRARRCPRLRPPTLFRHNLVPHFWTPTQVRKWASPASHPSGANGFVPVHAAFAACSIGRWAADLAWRESVRLVNGRSRFDSPLSLLIFFLNNNCVAICGHHLVLMGSSQSGCDALFATGSIDRWAGLAWR